MEVKEGQVVENDNCVSCCKDTGIPKNMHVDVRPWYTDGGQLCKECFEEIYGKTRS